MTSKEYLRTHIAELERQLASAEAQQPLTEDFEKLRQSHLAQLRLALGRLKRKLARQERYYA